MHGKKSLLLIVLLMIGVCLPSSAAELGVEPVLLHGIPMDVAAVSRKKPLSIDPLQCTARYHALVQFKTPLGPKDREEMEKTGIRFLYYVHPNAYFMAGPGNRLAEARGLKSVAGLILVPSQTKIDPALYNIPPDPETATEKTLEAAELQTVKVLFYPDTSFEQAQEALIAHGAILEATRTRFDYQQTLDSVSLPAEALPSLAGEDCVFLITEVDPPAEALNVNARDTSNLDEIQPGGITGYNLTGAGVGVGIWDVGAVRLSHVEFEGRATQEDGKSLGFYDAHATHVAGIIGAGGVGPQSATGMAPDARLYCFDTGNDLYEAEKYADRISVSNHSYASSLREEESVTPTSSSYISSLNGKYISRSQAWDNVVKRRDLIVVRAAGNERRYLLEPGAATSAIAYNTILPVATSKNVVTVGAVEDLTDEPPNPAESSMTEFSSWGPTDDGRIKPDVVANGRRLTSTAVSTDIEYGPYSGTSMSAPVVTGTIACLVQQFRRQFAGSSPSAALIKAILIHTARDGGNLPGPDCRFGWGLVDGRAAADLIRNQGSKGNLIDLGFYSDETRNYVFEYVGSGPIRVTLVWTDPPGVPSYAGSEDTSPNLVNDLDVLVYGPDGEHYPWTLDVSDPTIAARQDRENHLDNVEQVYIESPVPGTYAVWIDGQVDLGQIQEYALCISGLELGGEMPHVMHTVFTGLASEDIVDGTIPIQLSVLDNEGAIQVEFKVDDVTIDDPSTESVEGIVPVDPPLFQFARSISWNSATVKNGSHTIQATVTSNDRTTTETRSISIYTLNETEMIPLIVEAPVEPSRINPQGDIDWFVFQPPESATYSIETVPLWNLYPADTILTLYGPDNLETILTVNDDGGYSTLSKITYIFEKDRTYYVTVNGYENTTGPYGIVVYPSTDTPSPGVIPLIVNGPYASNETGTKDLDQYYSFRTSVFGTHVIRTRSETAEISFLPSILLSREGLGKEFVSSSNPGEWVQRVLQENQTYLIKASLAKGSFIPYEIGVTTAATGEITPLEIDGPSRTRQFPVPEPAEHWFAIESPDETCYTRFELSSLAEPFTTGPILLLYGPDTVEEFQVQGSPRSDSPLVIRMSATLNPGHTYYLKVLSDGWSGSYSIRAQRILVEDFGSIFTVTRSFSPERYRPGENVKVTLTIHSYGDTGIQPYNFLEHIPRDWTPRKISDPGEVLGSSSIWWYIIPEGATQLSYELEPSENVHGPYKITGQTSYRVLNKTYGVRITGETRLEPWVETPVETWQEY